MSPVTKWEVEIKQDTHRWHINEGIKSTILTNAKIKVNVFLREEEVI